MSIFDEAKQVVSKALASGLCKNEAIVQVAHTFSKDGTDDEVAVYCATEFVNTLTKDIIWN